MSELREYGMWIEGREVPAVSRSTFEIENPSTREIVARVAQGVAEDVDRAVDVATGAART